MSYALAIARYAVTTGPKKMDEDFWESYSAFLTILQRTHGMWKMRNAMRVMRVLTSPFEQSPSPVSLTKKP